MITEEQLKSIGYLTKEGVSYRIPGTWEHDFNIKTQYLWNFNKGVGQPQFIEHVTDFKRLKELLEINDN
jgi:hypothetical protein